MKDSKEPKYSQKLCYDLFNEQARVIEEADKKFIEEVAKTTSLNDHDISSLLHPELK